MATSVTLRVYDLSRGIARQMSPALLGKTIDGIWHTGVLVFGREYFFGGGGIQALAPEVVVARYGMEPVQLVPLGDTPKTQAQLEEFLRANAYRFTGDTYDLLRHNCNNFSDDVATFLVGHGIPRAILDLPNEALSTPLGAMFRPMLENMQRDMGGAHAFGNPFNDTTLGSSPLGFGGASTASSSAPVAPSRIATLSRKFTVSSSPTLHLDKIVRRIESLTTQQHPKCLRDADLAALRELQLVMATHRVDFSQAAGSTKPSDTGILQWWKIVETLVQQGPLSPVFFPALGLFRVVLLLPTRSLDVLEIKTKCLDDLLRATESETTVLSPAQTVLLLTVLVNGFANPAATELLQARALHFLPFVFRAITDTNVKNQDVRVMSAKLISNCCLAMKIEEEMVITTIICGCAEVMDALLREAAIVSSQQHVHLTLEGIVVGLGLLLQNFQAARSLSVELGLAEVLRRLHGSPALRSMQPLLSEVVALI